MLDKSWGLDLAQELNSFVVSHTNGFVYLVGSFITCVLQGQVHHRVLQSAAHVELQREVVDALQEKYPAG